MLSPKPDRHLVFILSAVMDRIFSTSLLYRYFFFDWMFKDVRRGNRKACAAAWQHNLQQARWLSIYLRRWSFLSLLFYAFGLATEFSLGGLYLPAFLYVCAVAGISVNAVIAASMLGFRYLPAPNFHA